MGSRVLTTEAGQRRGAPRFEALVRLPNTGFSLRAAVMIGLTFLPYVAIPVGEFTAVPVAAFFAVLYARELLARPQLLVPLLVLALTPVLMLFVQSLIGYGEGSEIAAVVWMAQIAPFGGAAAAVATAPHTVRITLRVFLIAAAAYTAVQKYFLDNGVIPFVSLYEMPGYWSVPENAEVIIEYVRRPFGWFPEPSFMAGTLVLGAMALVLLSYSTYRRLPAIDTVTAAVVVAGMLLGESGSALLTVPVLGALVFLPFSSALRRGLAGLLGVAAFAYLAIELLTARNATPNESWDDRASSILAGVNYLLDTPTAFLVGVGSGGAPVLYLNYEIPLDGLVAHSRLHDIFSVSGRMLIENGAIGGGLMLLVLIVPIVRSFAADMSWTFGLMATFAWLAVVTLTISYDSAAWLWAFPGVCLGVVAVVAEHRTRGVDGQEMHASAAEPGRLP